MIYTTNTTFEYMPQVLGSLGSTIGVSVMLLFQHHLQEFLIYLVSINTINNIRFLFCFCNIFGILLPLLRMPGLLACKPIPFKGVFVFCPIPIFCSKIFSLFHNLFFSYSNHSLHTHASSKKELNDFAERPYHHLFSGAVYFCLYQICFHQKLVLFYLVNQIRLNDMLFAQTISPFF